MIKQKHSSFRLPVGKFLILASLLLLWSTQVQASNDTRYFVGVCSCVYGSTSYRTQFELVNEETYDINGQLSFFGADGGPSNPEYVTVWTGDSGSIELSDGITNFSVPGKSTLVILTTPAPEGGLGWAKLEIDGPLHSQAALQTAKMDHSAKSDDFDQTIQYQAELHSVEAQKDVAFPISLYAGLKHLSTAFTVVNLSGSKATVKLTFRPDAVREIELEPGELMADYFERFWPLSFPAIYPLQLRGNAEISSDAPLAVGVFRTINGFPDLGIRVASLTSSEDREAVDIPLDTEFDLRIDQIVKISETDLNLELWDIVEDSRCPIDVLCVWEGRVLADLHLNLSEESGRTIQLSTLTDANSAEFGGYRITLVSVEPAPVSTEQLGITDYVLRLVVSTVD